MGMKAIKKAVVVTGQYKDRQTGADKKSYGTIGKLLERDDGSLCLKLDLMPGPDFDGWINFYDQDIEKVKEVLAAPDDDAPF